MYELIVFHKYFNPDLTSKVTLISHSGGIYLKLSMLYSAYSLKATYSHLK